MSLAIEEIAMALNIPETTSLLLESENLPRCLHEKEISSGILEALNAKKLEADYSPNQLEKLINTMNIYLENPTYLDLYLNEWIGLITNRLMQLLKSEEFKKTDGLCSDQASQLTIPCILFYQLAKIRGYKSITKFLDHAVLDAPLILIQTIRIIEAPCEVDWTCRYVFLLWLALHLQCPFELKRVFKTPGADITCLWNFLNGPCIRQQLLQSPGKDSDVLAFLLASTLKRPDSGGELGKFFDWIQAEGSGFNSNLVLGVMKVLAQLLKSIDPNLLTVSQRLTIHAFLKNRKDVAGEFEKSSLKLHGGLIENLEELNESTAILASLSHKDSQVRWVGAKTLRRLCQRLECGQVIGAMLLRVLQGELLKSATVSIAALHGILLAFGQLLTHRQYALEFSKEGEGETLFLALRACLRFDQIKGNYAVGAFVRDAACYVIWSMARYQQLDPPTQLAAFSLLFPGLLSLALFDREVSCRRAAAATLQELVGRMNCKSSLSLEILAVMHFHSTSTAEKSFKETFNAILKMISSSSNSEDLGSTFKDHLLQVSAFSFDVKIRRLASEALYSFHRMTASPSPLPDLLDLFWHSDDLFAQHFSLLALALFIKNNLLPSFDVEILEVSWSMEKISLKTLGADLLLCGHLELVSSIFERMPHDGEEEAVSRLLKNLSDALRSRFESVRQAAVLALHSLPQASVKREGFFRNLFDSIEAKRGDLNAQMGYLAAFSAAPQRVSDGLLELIGKLLIKAICTLVPINDVDRRCVALNSLKSLWPHLKSSLSSHAAVLNVLSTVVLTDYTIDARGDIGSKVRECGLLFVEQHFPAAMIPDSLIEAVCFEAFARLNRLRSLARKCLGYHQEVESSYELMAIMFSPQNSHPTAISGCFKGLIYSAGGLDIQLAQESLEIFFKQVIGQNEEKEGNSKQIAFEAALLNATAEQRMGPAVITCLLRLFDFANLDFSHFSPSFFNELASSLKENHLLKSKNIRRLLDTYKLVIQLAKHDLLAPEFRQFLQLQRDNPEVYPAIRQLISESPS